MILIQFLGSWVGRSYLCFRHYSRHAVFSPSCSFSGETKDNKSADVEFPTMAADSLCLCGRGGMSTSGTVQKMLLWLILPFTSLKNIESLSSKRLSQSFFFPSFGLTQPQKHAVWMTFVPRRFFFIHFSHRNASENRTRTSSVFFKFGDFCSLAYHHWTCLDTSATHPGSCVPMPSDFSSETNFFFHVRLPSFGRTTCCRDNWSAGSIVNAIGPPVFALKLLVEFLLGQNHLRMSLVWGYTFSPMLTFAGLLACTLCWWLLLTVDNAAKQPDSISSASVDLSFRGLACGTLFASSWLPQRQACCPAQIHCQKQVLCSLACGNKWKDCDISQEHGFFNGEALFSTLPVQSLFPEWRHFGVRPVENISTKLQWFSRLWIQEFTEELHHLHGADCFLQKQVGRNTEAESGKFPPFWATDSLSSFSLLVWSCFQEALDTAVSSFQTPIQNQGGDQPTKMEGSDSPNVCPKFSFFHLESEWASAERVWGTWRFEYDSMREGDSGTDGGQNLTPASRAGWTNQTHWAPRNLCVWGMLFPTETVSRGVAHVAWMGSGVFHVSGRYPHSHDRHKRKLEFLSLNALSPIKCHLCHRRFFVGKRLCQRKAAARRIVSDADPGFGQATPDSKGLRPKKFISKRAKSLRKMTSKEEICLAAVASQWHSHVTAVVFTHLRLKMTQVFLFSGLPVVLLRKYDGEAKKKFWRRWKCISNKIATFFTKQLCRASVAIDKRLICYQFTYFSAHGPWQELSVEPTHPPTHSQDVTKTHFLVKMYLSTSRNGKRQVLMASLESSNLSWPLSLQKENFHWFSSDLGWVLPRTTRAGFPGELWSASHYSVGSSEQKQHQVLKAASWCNDVCLCLCVCAF